MKTGQFAHEVQAEPGAGDIPIGQTYERLEYESLVLGRDAEAVVGDSDHPVRPTLLASHVDFGRLFKRLEGDGYQGPYMLTFGNRPQKIEGREYLLRAAAS